MCLLPRATLHSDSEHYLMVIWMELMTFYFSVALSPLDYSSQTMGLSGFFCWKKSEVENLPQLYITLAWDFLVSTDWPNEPIWAPDEPPKILSILVSNSPRYSNFVHTAHSQYAYNFILRVMRRRIVPKLSKIITIFANSHYTHYFILPVDVYATNFILCIWQSCRKQIRILGMK
jgi:hypothetical protein